MIVQPIKNATKSDRSLADEIPAKAIALPGAKPAGALSHLSKLPADHFKVAFDDKAPEYENPSLEAMF